MLSTEDRAQLAELGIGVEEIERQLRLFADPPPAPMLDRPCTIGDGILQLSIAQRAAAEAAYARAAAAGRLCKFVPASGAATRMFQSLLAVRAEAGPVSRAALAARADRDANAQEALTTVDRIERFPFIEALRAVLARAGNDLDRLRRADDLGPLLDAFISAAGLGLPALPKALLPFHRYADGARTAFEEHLGEGAVYGRDRDGVARFHFTVSPEHGEAFEHTLAAVRRACEARGAARLEVGFSTQPPATDTIAADVDHQPFRTADRRLLFRPGGHGALIENLNALHGDIVFIKTIDNIQPEHLRAASLEWLRLLTGHLAALQAEIAEHCTALVAEPITAARLDAVREFAGARLAVTVEAACSAAELRTLLDRPVRVCGVVRNTGEPGGGPFWVRGPDGRSTAQIVESAQVDQRDPEQRARFAAATHFNPVFMACGVRDWRGRPFDLRQFVDASAVFIARKSKDGRELQALERPGLWNGAMAHWHTVFVEIPLETFTPVKTLNDLLRPAHQPAEESGAR